MYLLLLAIIYLSFIALGLPDSLLGSAWPVMHVDLNIDKSLASLLSMIVGMGTIITSSFTGRLVKKLGTSRLTAISILITAFGLLGIYLSNHLIFLILSSILLGVGAGAVDAGLNDYVSRNYKAQHMSFLHSFWGIGVTTSPILMGIFIANANWRIGYLTIAIIQFVLAFIIFISYPLWQKNSEEKKENIAPFKHPILIPGVIFAMLFFAFYCGCENTIGTWGATFLVNVKNISPSNASFYVSFFFGGITLSRILSGFLLMKIKDKYIIIGGMIALLLGLFSLFISENVIPGFVGLLLIGLGCGPIYPCSIHLTHERFGRENSASIVGYQVAFAGVGFTFIQPLTGLIATKIGLSILPVILIGFCIMLFILFITIQKITSKNIEKDV